MMQREGFERRIVCIVIASITTMSVAILCGLLASGESATVQLAFTGTWLSGMAAVLLKLLRLVHAHATEYERSDDDQLGLKVGLTGAAAAADREDAWIGSGSAATSISVRDFPVRRITPHPRVRPARDE